MRAPAVLLLLLTLASACELLEGSGSANDPLIRTDRSTYAVDDTIKARVANTTSQTLFLQNCCGPLTLNVERHQEDGWVAYRRGVCVALCLSVPLELRPGQTRAAPPMTLDEPGRYRLTVDYWNRQKADAVAQQIYSAPFTVE